MALTYEIFELEISSIRRNQYHSSVIGSAGEARAAFQLPFSGGELELRLKDLEIALLRSSGVRRQILRPEEQTVQNFGRELFDALITGEIRSRYDVSQERARREGKGLRIKLRIQASDLAVLPWEFLFDSRANEFVCLSRYTPLVRYLELPQPVPPLAVTPPLRILALIASPSDLPPLDVAAEKARVEEALHPLRKRGLVELTWLEGQSWRVVQRAMRSGTWHVFHFVGHGGYDAQRDEGLIALAETGGKAQFCTATDLARLLADHQSLRLVLLNACEGGRSSGREIFSSTAATLVRRGIPAVVAMQYAISDAAAIEFAQTFYESLADNLPVDASVNEARKAIALGQSLEWGVPVLYMRAVDGVIFDVQTSAAPVMPSQAEPVVSKAEVLPDSLPDFDWVTIPTGEFIMGSDRTRDPEASHREGPTGSLFLPAYRIARAPVTVEQFRRFVEATGYRTMAEEQGAATIWVGAQRQIVQGTFWALPYGPNSRRPAKPDHPVTCVAWRDVLAFCAWAGVRLPSEAEWEKAARGTDGRRYPWGDERPDAQRMNIKVDGGNTTPVGSYPAGASPFGIQDVAGNVWEWTSSLYRPYPYVANDGRENLEATGDRVVRGGSFVHTMSETRCAYRFRVHPAFCSNIVGFRVAALD